MGSRIREFGLSCLLIKACLSHAVCQDDVIRYRACLLLKTLLLDSEPVQAIALQYAAVNYGVLLWQLRKLVMDVVEDEEQAMRDSVSAVPVSEAPLPAPPPSNACSYPVTQMAPSPSVSSQRALTKDLIVLICMENDLSYETMSRALPLGKTHALK